MLLLLYCPHCCYNNANFPPGVLLKHYISQRLGLSHIKETLCFVWMVGCCRVVPKPVLQQTFIYLNSYSKLESKRKRGEGKRSWQSWAKLPHQRIRVNPGSKRAPTSATRRSSVTDKYFDVLKKHLIFKHQWFHTSDKNCEGLPQRLIKKMKVQSSWC